MRKRLILAALVLSVFCVAGCGKKDEDEATAQGTTEEAEIEVDEDSISMNAILLYEAAYPTASDEGALGTAQRLAECGCKDIDGITSFEDTGKCYTVEVVDTDGQMFVFTMSYEGYPGPIQDADGEYLYMPVDD